MALQSKDDIKWVYSEATRAPDTLDIKMRVGIRAHDGWIVVLDLIHGGWLATGLPTRRQMLENMQQNITLELAKLTLEET